jgi:hypothetical protein
VTRDQPERFVQLVRSFIEADDENHTADAVHAELADLRSKWRWRTFAKSRTESAGAGLRQQSNYAL